MRALFLTKYGLLAATSRYRAFQYFDALAYKGWDVTLDPLFSDGYIERLYDTGRRSAVDVGGSLFRRALHLRRLKTARYDVIYVQYECLPRLPFALESAFFRSHRVVVDYDDAVHELYRARPLLHTKISSVMRAATEVIVGNQNLRAYAEQFNRSVSLIPTVIDTTRYSPRASYRRQEERFIIGWVGTPVTAKFLEMLGGVFQSLDRQFPLTVRCLGVPRGWSIPGVNVEAIPWSEEAERRYIPTFDVGVMPLPNDAFTRGKCGFKLIQYMGCGVPAIGSVVGANCEIIRHGENGMAAANSEQFRCGIEALYLDATLRERLGRAGRRTAEGSYSLSVWAPRFCDVFDRAARGGLGRSSEPRASAAYAQA